MTTTFKRALFGLSAAMLLTVSSLATAQDVTGAGASFPAPLYAKWASEYNKSSGVKINYQSVGSGAGIRQIDAKTVDFGASDMPLKDEDLAKKDQVQFPTVIGGVVPVVNIPGIAAGQLKLTGALIADIYLGKISKWSDQPRPEPAGCRHRPGAPCRRLRHHLHLHQLPEQGQQRVERQGRRRHRRELAHRCRWQGQ